MSATRTDMLKVGLLKMAASAAWYSTRRSGVNIDASVTARVKMTAGRGAAGLVVAGWGVVVLVVASWGVAVLVVAG